MKTFHKYILMINILFGSILCIYFFPKRDSKKSAVEYINSLKKPVIVINKVESDFSHNIKCMLIEDGNKKLHYLTNNEYDLSPFIYIEIYESIQ